MYVTVKIFKKDPINISFTISFHPFTRRLSKNITNYPDHYEIPQSNPYRHFSKTSVHTFRKKTSNEIVPHLFYNPIIKGKRVIAGRREETKNHYLFSKTLIFSIILLYPVFLGYIIIFLNRRHARRVGMKQKIKYLLYNVDIKTDSFFLYF